VHRDVVGSCTGRDGDVMGTCTGACLQHEHGRDGGGGDGGGGGVEQVQLDGHGAEDACNGHNKRMPAMAAIRGCLQWPQ
jgi:hypothetical protein